MTLKSLFSKPATKLYPLEKPHFFEQTKGRVHLEPDSCRYCGLCASVCPTQALDVDRKALTWSIDRFRCIQCRSCIEACHEGALSMLNHYTDPAQERVVEVYEVSPQERQRREQARYWMYETINEHLRNHFYHNSEMQQRLQVAEQQVLTGAKTSFMAAADLLDVYYKRDGGVVLP